MHNIGIRGRMGNRLFYCGKSGFPGGASGKELTCQRRRCRDAGSSLGGEDSPEEEMQPTPVFLLGESHGQGILAGYSPWGHKKLT